MSTVSRVASRSKAQRSPRAAPGRDRVDAHQRRVRRERERLALIERRAGEAHDRVGPRDERRAGGHAGAERGARARGTEDLARRLGRQEQRRAVEDLDVEREVIGADQAAAEAGLVDPRRVAAAARGQQAQRPGGPRTGHDRAARDARDRELRGRGHRRDSIGACEASPPGSCSIDRPHGSMILPSKSRHGGSGAYALRRRTGVPRGSPSTSVQPSGTEGSVQS